MVSTIDGANEVNESDKVEGVTLSDNAGANAVSDRLAGAGVTPRRIDGANAVRVSAFVLGVVVSFRDGANVALVSATVAGVTLVVNFSVGAKVASVNAAVVGVTIVGPCDSSPMISSRPTNVGLALDNVNEAEALDPIVLYIWSEHAMPKPSIRSIQPLGDVNVGTASATHVA